MDRLEDLIDDIIETKFIMSKHSEEIKDAVEKLRNSGNAMVIDVNLTLALEIKSLRAHIQKLDSDIKLMKSQINCIGHEVEDLDT